jgi:hypothetical protein
VRAAVWTPDLGDIEFAFDDTKSKGVIVLTTQNGLHKFSYDVRKINGYEVTLNLESPYVNNGIATSKFIINTLDDVYRCRVSLNNDHFLSGHFDLKNGGFNSQFELQTTLLSYRVELEAGFSNTASEMSATGAFSYSTRHSAELHFDKTTLGLIVAINSKLIPFESIEVTTGLKLLKGQYEASLLIKYGEDTINFNTQIIHTKKFDIDGSLSFAASKYTLLKGNMLFKFKLDEQILLIDVTTSHPRFSKMKIHCKSVVSDSNIEYIGSLSLPISGHDNYELHIKTDKTPWTKKSLEISLFTPSGEYLAINSWDLANTHFHCNLKVDSPFGSYFVISKTSWKVKLTSHTVLNVPLLKKAVIDFDTTETLTAAKNVISVKVDVMNKITEAKVEYDMDASLVAKIKLPIPGYEHYKVALGYANNKRKMLKGHVEYPTGAVGVQLDYLFHSIKDFVILAQFDFPSAEWSDLTLDITNKIKKDLIEIRLGGKLKKSKANLNFLHQNNKGDITTKIDALILDHSATFKYIIAVGASNLPTHNAEMNVKSSHINSVARLSAEETLKGLDIDLNIEANGKQIVLLTKSSIVKTINLVIKDIGLPFLFSNTITYDLNELRNYPGTTVGTMGIQTTFCLDTTKDKENSAVIETKIRKMTNGGDITCTAKLPGGKAMSFKANHLKKESKLTSSAVFFSGKNKIVGYEYLAVYPMNTPDNPSFEETQRITVIIPFYTFEYDCHGSGQLSSKSESANLKWGPTGSALRGIGYLFTEERAGDKTEARLILRRPIGPQFADHTLAFILQADTGKASLDVKVDHPSPAQTMSLKVKTEVVNDIEKLMAGAMVGYTVAGKPLRFVNVETKVDKVNGVISLNVRTSANSLRLEGKWKSRNKVHTGEFVAYLNNLKYLNIISDLNGNTPAADIHILIRDVTNINIFAGLQSEKDAIVKITHTALGADVEDVKLIISLVDGDKIATTAQWRREVLDDLNAFITKITNSIEATNAEQFWTDVDTAQVILHTAAKDIVDDLIYVSNIRIKEVFVQLKSFTNSFRGKSPLLTQIADSLDSFADFGIAYADEIQNISKLVARTINGLVDAFFKRVKADLVILRGLLSGLQAEIIQYLKYITPDLHKIAEYLEANILKFKGTVELFVSKYKEMVSLYTGLSVDAINKFLLKLGTDLQSTYHGVAVYLKQFRIVMMIVETFHEYQTWLEEIHFTQHVQAAITTLQGTP